MPACIFFGNGFVQQLNVPEHLPVIRLSFPAHNGQMAGPLSLMNAQLLLQLSQQHFRLCHWQKGRTDCVRQQQNLGAFQPPASQIICKHTVYFVRCEDKGSDCLGITGVCVAGQIGIAEVIPLSNLRFLLRTNSVVELKEAAELSGVALIVIIRVSCQLIESRRVYFNLRECFSRRRIGPEIGSVMIFN